MGSRNRSKKEIVQSAVGVKAWLHRLPTVDEVRPARCPACGAASRVVGRALSLVGHGVRDRQQRGPLDVSGEPMTVTVCVRRYLCVACKGTTTVAPRGVVRHRHYSAAAIGLAVALYGLQLASQTEVRRRVSPWRRVGDSAAGRWVALLRWLRAVKSGSLFAGVRAVPSGFTLRQIAERAGASLAACAPPTERHRPLVEQAFLGAPAMA